jgi:hypothetical protein
LTVVVDLDGDGDLNLDDSHRSSRLDGKVHVAVHVKVHNQVNDDVYVSTYLWGAALSRRPKRILRLMAPCRRELAK